MNKLFKIIYIFTLILMFLPAFAFYIGNRSYRVLFIAMIIFFVLFILFNFKYFINNLLKLTKFKTFKTLLIFLAYIIISTIFIVINGIYKPINALSYVIQFVFFYVLPSFLLSAFFVPKLFKINSFIKFLLSAYFLIFVFGLFEFAGKLYHIDFIISIQQFLANERVFSIGLKEYTRLSSVFAEPGWLGYFIFINFPIIYACSLSKVKFFENKYINMLIKKSLIPLAWFNIIFTLSPIWLIACIVQLLFVIKKSIIKCICNLKIVIPLAVIVISIMWFLVNFVFKSETSQLDRILNTVNVKSFDTFVIAEPSLASRVVSYINAIRLFNEHPILGIGIDNSANMLVDKFRTSPVPLTTENLYKYKKSFISGKMEHNTAILYRLLCETGIIGMVLFYIFMFTNLMTLRKIKNKLVNQRVLVFSNGIDGAIIAIIISSIYDSFLIPYLWFFMGIITSICVYHTKQLKLQKRGDHE